MARGAHPVGQARDRRYMQPFTKVHVQAQYVHLQAAKLHQPLTLRRPSGLVLGGGPPTGRAAAVWLADRGQQASFEYARPDGAPLGSVVDVRWQHAALRVHLDQTVAPV